MSRQLPKRLVKYHRKWEHTKGAAALLMMNTQRLYHEAVEIWLRLESIQDKPEYLKHIGFRKQVLAALSKMIKDSDALYSTMLDRSVPLINKDNKLMESRGEIPKGKVRRVSR